MTLNIEPAEPADEAQVVAIWRSCGLVTSYNDPAKDFHSARAQASSDVLVGRAESGQVIASAMVGYDGHRGWLYYIACRPEDRGRGYGKKMLDAGESWLKARGVAKLQLLVRNDNKKAMEWYEKLSFARSTSVLFGKWLK